MFRPAGLTLRSGADVTFCEPERALKPATTYSTCFLHLEKLVSQLFLDLACSDFFQE